MSAGAPTGVRPAPAGAPAALPRLLAGIPAAGALALDGHLALHGPLPLPQGRQGPQALIEEVQDAGLRGRGGAAFPTAAKLRAVADASRRAFGRPIVVVNAAEGEPGSAKDRTLLGSLPHLVLDGAALAAAAVGAREALLGVCESAGGALEATRHAIAARTDRNLFTAVAVPATYVAGQESALVSFLGGGPALPTFGSRPFERGVRGRPTLVANAETLAHLALIARYGADWFRELGTPAQPGSALVTLSGPVAHPGVYEIEHGSPLAALVDAAGGETEELRAVLVGGYGGTWLDADVALGGSWAAAGRGASPGGSETDLRGGGVAGVALAEEHLAPHGAALGAGVVMLLPAAACPVAEMARITRWLAAHSARQCGPCLFGLDAIATLFERLAHGSAAAAGRDRAGGSAAAGSNRAGGAAAGRDRRPLDGRAVLERLRELAGLVQGRGACGHPDGAARLVASAVAVFGEELAAHALRGPCAACPGAKPRRTRVTSRRRELVRGAR